MHMGMCMSVCNNKNQSKRGDQLESRAVEMRLEKEDVGEAGGGKRKEEWV